MVLRGEVLPVGVLLRRALRSTDPGPHSSAGVRHTAAANAARCAALLAAGGTPEECWRFGILQTVDDYTSKLSRGGLALAAGVFTTPPPLSGSANVDAGFAALADFLADRDSWSAPAWTSDPTRRTHGWYPAVPSIFRAEADRDSPRAFRERGIFITQASLNRA